MGAVPEDAPGRPRAESERSTLPQRARVTAAVTAVRTAPSAMSFKIGELPQGQEVREVLSQQLFEGWVQIEPSGFVRAQDLRPLAPADILPQTPRRQLILRQTSSMSTDSDGASQHREAAPLHSSPSMQTFRQEQIHLQETNAKCRAELEELQRSCATERETLRRVKAEIEHYQKQHGLMKDKLERCHGAILHAVGAMDSLYEDNPGEKGDGNEKNVASDHIIDRKQTARMAGSVISHLLSTWDVQDVEAYSPIDLSPQRAEEGKTAATRPLKENSIGLSAPRRRDNDSDVPGLDSCCCPKNDSDVTKLDRRCLEQRSPLRAIN